MRRGVFPGVAACVLVCGPSLADVRVDPAAPFAADELAAALAARGGPPDVVVVAAAGDAVHVQVAGRTFHVALGGARGRSAARIVAAHVADLRSMPPPPPPPAIAVGERTHLEVSAGLGISGGAQSRDLTSLRGAIDVRGGQTWQWMAGVAWTHGPARSSSADQPVGASDIGVARTGLGVAGARVDLTTGPLLARYRVDGGAATGWGLGWHGAVRLHALTSGRWRLHATLDGEWLQHRVVVRYDGAEVAATPRVAISAGLSLGWEVVP